MKPRAKKLIGLAILIPGLVLYIAAAATFADALPQHWLAKLLYFLVAGLAWAFPVIPLMNWMNRE